MKAVSKDTRIDCRIKIDQKELIARAATMLGLSMSDFIVSSAYNSALDMLQKLDNAVKVPYKDFERLLAALDADSEPSPVAVEEVKEYNTGCVQGDKYEW